MASVADLFRRFFHPAPMGADALRWQRDLERDAATEKRLQAVESRRESERRWYARLPIIAIGTLCVAVAALTALLVVAAQYTQPAPAAKVGPDKAPPAPPAPASRPASITMSLMNKELFGYNSSALRVLSGAAQRELDACLAPELTQAHIVGHADCIGSDAFNQDLSERRAAAVMRYLTASGVEGAIITTEGRGATLSKADPICAGVVRSTAANVARLERFRRVDVTCEFSKQAMADLAADLPRGVRRQGRESAG